MSALAGLVERGLVAPDWAEALAPVDAGHHHDGHLPARRALRRPGAVPPPGRPDLPRVQPAPGRGEGARRRPGPLPHARSPGRAVLLGRAGRPPDPAEPGQHLHRARQRPRLPIPEQRRPDPLVRARRDAAQPGPQRGARCAGQPPRPGLGAGHRARRSAPSPRAAAPRAAILWGRDAQSLKPMLAAGDVPWVESVHPSPLSASRGFFGSKPFSRVNRCSSSRAATPSTGGSPDPSDVTRCSVAPGRPARPYFSETSA